MKRLLFIVAVIFGICNSAAAQTWQTLSIPTRITTVPGEVLGNNPPYVLGYPSLTAPHYRILSSAQESNVKGIRFRGDFQKLGSGTALNNHYGFFASDDPAHYGNEYGLVWWLKNSTVKLYQCGLCNTANQLWTETTVYTIPTPPTSSQYLSFQVLVNADGSFTFKAVRPWAPYQVVTQVNVAKASWLPNMYNDTVTVVATIKRLTEDGGNHHPSVVHMDAIDVLK